MLHVIPQQKCPICGYWYLVVKIVQARTRGYCSEKCERIATEVVG